MVKVERIPKKAAAAAKAKASKASTPKAAKPEGSCKIEVLPEATSRKAASSKAKATAALSLAHGDVEHKKATEQRKSILDSLVRTIPQNTTDDVLVAFERARRACRRSEVLAAPAGVAEELVRCGGLAEVKMERVRAILADRVAGRERPASPASSGSTASATTPSQRTLSPFRASARRPCPAS
ncbi:hypothetical protein JL720_7840 [Aureococcus anophagefferens]|nr:hypothetical protein JL720_7840 [Aureococcus anophagefferens]